ncbi:MAG: penicillin acylase family protein [Thermoleophilaceae bacterium]
MRRVLIAVALAAMVLPAAATAAPVPTGYGEHDAGGFRDVLPPGTNGFDNAVQLSRFFSSGMTDRPPHNDDQLAMYRDLLYAAPKLSARGLRRYYKDSRFGSLPQARERTYSPRPDVTIVRDRFGVPHITGSTRSGAMYGIGYATAEDRLFFIDVLRHLGRAQLASFAGGTPSNVLLDREIWHTAPYTEEDLQRQVDQVRPGFVKQANRIRADETSYVAGVNAYIAEARLNPLKMPAEYAAIGQPQGPDDWNPRDSVAVATLVGAIFGAGGGGELKSALVLQRAQSRFGRRLGRRVWRDFRSANDPEAPTTVRGHRFSYEPSPKHAHGVAMPDRGSLRDFVDLDASTTNTKAVRRFAVPKAMSNALVVSARRSASGHPLAVFGPQVAYFAPEILMEQDVHAPGLDARGASFPGANLYVSLGHGRDYAWSATSAGQDLTDTYAVPLCEPGGGAATLSSDHYLFRGRCLSIEVLKRTDTWKPNAADQTPPGSETFTSQRTALGIVTARARVRGRPVLYTKLRSTYLHEPDSSLGLSLFNQPGSIRGPRDFQRAASLIGYTFNWFYVDSRHTAYLNSGADPIRPRDVDPDLPVMGRRRYEWRGWNPATNVTPIVPVRRRARAIDQSWMTSWNNKQALGIRAADGNWGYGSVYRSQPLDVRVRAALRGGRRMTLPKLVGAMEDAATVDLRGSHVLPWALKVIGRPRGGRLGHAVDVLRAWQRAGAHRIDRNRDGRYDDAEAVRIMDAWWPRWLRAEFEPALGKKLFASIEGVNEFVNAPNNSGQHLGSAWQAGWYSYAQKDLRTVLGRRVRGRYSRVYCGGGKLARCRTALRGSLREALAVPAARLYSGDKVCKNAGRDGSQTCFDSIYFRPLGAITQPLIPWQNRPTYQQAVEVPRRAGR